MSDYFPTMTDAFLFGQDILYAQFNEIDVYVEDERHENFYYQVLRKVCPDIRLEKIFPLNGKNNVVSQAKLTSQDKKKIFIVDRDFDDILGKIEPLPNLFYLRRYSIENYLLEENAIREFVIEQKPRTERSAIISSFVLTDFLKESIELFSEIAIIYFVVQIHELGLINVKNKPDKFFTFNPSARAKNDLIIKYMGEVECLLKQKDRRLSLRGQIRKYKKYFKNIDRIPGKYLMRFLQSRICHLFSTQIEIDSFVYRVAKNCRFDSLLYLQEGITNFVGSPTTIFRT